MKELPTFKDNDFLDEGCKLHLPDDAKQKLLDMLSSDTAVSVAMFFVWGNEGVQIPRSEN